MTTDKKEEKTLVVTVDHLGWVVVSDGRGVTLAWGRSVRLEIAAEVVIAIDVARRTGRAAIISLSK